MTYFSYVVARDFGFAPNPFNGFCTLATCKPQIRQHAQVGDWVLGSGSKMFQRENSLIFAMKVTEKMSFDEYWNSQRFQTKKPVMNGSLKKMYGDNIYHKVDGNWVQADSHHSLVDGLPNEINISRDTSVNAVLISDYFFYFGKNSFPIPEVLLPHVVKSGPGYRHVDENWGEILINNIVQAIPFGYQDDPIQFTHFERYPGAV